MTERDGSRLIGGVRYVTALDLARSLGVSRQTLWRWRSEGSIPAGSRFRNKEIVFTVEEAAQVRAFAERLVPVRVVGEEGAER
jgi:hypothetical protein